MKLEGMLLGFSTCINKLVLGFVIFLFEQVINRTGFDIAKSKGRKNTAHKISGAKAELPEKTLMAMKIMFVVIPTFFLTVSFICNYFIKISVPEMKRIQEVAMTKIRINFPGA